MSVSDFDPAIEKAYWVTPEFADSALFNAEVEVRLENRWRWRRALLVAVSLFGMFVFIRQFISIRISGLSAADALVDFVGRKEKQAVLQPLVGLSDQLGLADISQGILSGPYLLMLAGAVIAVLLTATAVRLSNSL